MSARHWRIGGRVQGVGFRPFVYRLAYHHQLSGWVRNSGGAVEIHAQGLAERLQSFGQELLTRAPSAARATLLEVRPTPVEQHAGFRILPSAPAAEGGVHVPADLHTCDECLAELRDPGARRHRYPFINCTQCGPRYTLIRSMPYDRPNTSLDRFPMCRDCAREYADPLDRRFHAQPLACGICGPTLSWHQGGEKTRGNEPALAAAISLLREGGIVAVRGVGGYHLLCSADDESAVRRLRIRKGRPAKPFALMVPWSGLDGADHARELVHLSALESVTLRDSVRPIVIASRRAGAPVAAAVAPGSHELAVMLPYSPLHHLLVQDFGAALVATSANLSGEPVLTEPEAVEDRLGGVADGFLHHDRAILRPADDPVVRVTAGAARPLRLGRGTAPLELILPRPLSVPTLAVGAYAKTTVALAWGDRAVVSPHIGDLASPRGREVLAQIALDLQHLYGVRAGRIAHDAHPGFPNARWSRASGLPTQAVWHHEAHASAVAGEYPDRRPMLVFTWDGVGLGPDGALWGGEALLGAPGAWRRVASFRPFRLPGGERAAREPWRSALGLCWECGEIWPEGENLGGPLLHRAFERGVNAPSTTSVGRLFDAAAALTSVCLQASYEAEAPVRLESLCEGAGVATHPPSTHPPSTQPPSTQPPSMRIPPIRLPLMQDAAGVWRSDWQPLVAGLRDARSSPAARAVMFHASLAEALCEQARAVRERSGVLRVGLGGGVFQNRVLTERAQSLLTAAGFEVLIPERLPVNDAAISYGQLIEAAAADAASAG